MILYELKKYILKPSVFICLIIFAVVNFVKFFELYYNFGGGRGQLADNGAGAGVVELYEKYGGIITDEKIAGLKADLDFAEKSFAENGVTEEASDKFYTGYAYGDKNEISDIIKKYQSAILYENTANELSQKADENARFFAGKNDYEQRKNELIRDTFSGRYIGQCVRSNGWETLFDFKFSAILTMLLIALMLSPIFAGERADGFDRLIISSGKRGAAIRSKLLTAGIVAFTVTLIFFILDVSYTFTVYGLSCFDAPLYAIYPNAPLNVTLLGALATAFIMRLAAMLFMAACVVLISSFYKNTGAALIISVLFGAALVVLTELLPSAFNPLELVYSSEFFSNFDTVNLFGLPCLQLFASIGFTLLLTLAAGAVTAIRGLR